MDKLNATQEMAMAVVAPFMVKLSDVLEIAGPQGLNKREVYNVMSRGGQMPQDTFDKLCVLMTMCRLAEERDGRLYAIPQQLYILGLADGWVSGPYTTIGAANAFGNATYGRGNYDILDVLPNVPKASPPPSPSFYVWALDGHVCYGPFADAKSAYTWGLRKHVPFQVMHEVPSTTVVIVPA